MKFARLLAAALGLLLLACQPVDLPTVNIIEDNRVRTVQTRELVPALILQESGVTLLPEDRLLVNGLDASPNQPLDSYPVTLQVRRAKNVQVKTAEGEQTQQSSAFTVGQALHEASVWIYAGDVVQPQFNSPLAENTSILVSPSATQPLTISILGKEIHSDASARSVGEALAEAGVALTGLDYTIPAEGQPLPANGQVRVVRVTESIQLAQQPIPFESEIQASADVPLDQTQILQPGETGLNVQRIRIRYEDGDEVSRLTEAETMVRPPRTRIMAYGTKIEVQSAVVDGVNLEYWRAVQMYATSYSPCRSGSTECHSGTSSGKSLRKGMVGLRYSWYLSMQGQQLYIPGYGFASVEDVCGGCVGRPWVDLGFSDNDFEPWHSWVTVYFLTPVPANVIYVLE